MSFYSPYHFRNNLKILQGDLTSRSLLGVRELEELMQSVSIFAILGYPCLFSVYFCRFFCFSFLVKSMFYEPFKLDLILKVATGK